MSNSTPTKSHQLPELRIQQAGARLRIKKTGQMVTLAQNISFKGAPMILVFIDGCGTQEEDAVAFHHSEIEEAPEKISVLQAEKSHTQTDLCIADHTQVEEAPNE